MLRIILAIAVSADVSHGFGFFDPPGELVEEPFALADCAGVVGGDRSNGYPSRPA